MNGIGSSHEGYPSRGKHWQTGNEYPDSPCGAGGPFGYDIKDVTCPACLHIIASKGKKNIERAEERLKELGL